MSILNLFKKRKMEFVSLDPIRMNNIKTNNIAIPDVGIIDRVINNDIIESIYNDKTKRFEKVKDKEETEPISILNLFVCKIPPKINQKNIPLKIKSLTEKGKLLKKLTGEFPEEYSEAINLLKAIQLFPKHVEKFKYPVTLPGIISELLTKYPNLKHASLKEYIKKLPINALNEIIIYSKSYEKVRRIKNNEIFSLIAPNKDFKSKDPILLGKSPFGDFYYILCAWDKEVDIVEDLFVK